MAEDLLQGLKDAVDGETIGKESEDPQAAIEKLLKSLENMPGLSEEDKKNLAEGLMGGGMGGFDPKLFAGRQAASPWMEFMVLFGLISFIILVLGYIGYKLYNNMQQRERRKEMKKLQREQKKKK